jgi:hypothetical protein
MKQLTISSEYFFYDIQTENAEYRVKYYGGYIHELYLLCNGDEQLIEAYSNCNELTKEQRKEYIQEIVQGYEGAFAS